MIEKVIFDNHSHHADEEEDEEADKEINLINVNNNYNITLPNANGVKEIITLNTSNVKKFSRLSSNVNSGSISMCKIR
jgi:hypothetical protein